MLQNGEDWVREYWVGDRTQPHNLTVDVESDISDFVFAEPEWAYVDGVQKFTIRIRAAEAMPVGRHKVRIAFLETVRQSGRMMKFLQGAGDVLTVIKPSDKPLPIMDVAYTDGELKGSIFNMGLSGLSDVKIAYTVSQDDRDLGSYSTNSMIIPSLESVPFTLQIPNEAIVPGVFEVHGFISTVQSPPEDFTFSFSSGSPSFHVSSEDPILAKDLSSIPLLINLTWNEPLEVNEVFLRSDDAGTVVFSAFKKNVTLNPGSNVVVFESKVRARTSKNVSAGLSFKWDNNKFDNRFDAFVKYAPPSLADTVEKNMLDSVETFKGSRNLQIVVIVMLAMIFASCFSAAIFKSKIDRLEDKIKELKS